MLAAHNLLPKAVPDASPPAPDDAWHAHRQQSERFSFTFKRLQASEGPAPDGRVPFQGENLYSLWIG